MIGAITTLLVCQLVGELMSRGLHLPVPGPVLGMIILLAGLLARGRDGETPPALEQAADALLGNLGLLFVPAGVGVVLYGPLLARNWAPIATAVLLGTVLAIGFTGWLAQKLLARFG
ncbi:MAG: CidA/LrgA family protein [Acetobacteraceae bacterium]|nr:CidA/LrgA family protein [Acetobacteraceae bacterium]